MEAGAREGGGLRGDNADRGATSECMEELDELLENPNVPQQEIQGPLQGGVEGLGDIKDQDVILLLTELPLALCQEHRQ